MLYIFFSLQLQNYFEGAFVYRGGQGDPTDSGLHRVLDMCGPSTEPVYMVFWQYWAAGWAETDVYKDSTILGQFSQYVDRQTEGLPCKGKIIYILKRYFLLFTNTIFFLKTVILPDCKYVK